MNKCKSQEEYLEHIIKPVRRVCKRYGYLPSVLIAQSCLENGYGMHESCYSLIHVNNMVGIKAELLNRSWSDKTVWLGESIVKTTPEEYSGKSVTIKDAFRVYDCPERSFADFLLFLTYASNQVGGAPKYGGEVLSLKDPESLIRALSVRGYATDSRYVSKVMAIIHKHNLTQYDDLTEEEPTIYIPGGIGMNSSLVSYTRLSPNNSGGRTHKIDRITPHCVVGQMQIESMLDWFSHSTTKASANYGIGTDGRIGLCVPESVRSWCSSSAENDQRAVTIECASDKMEPYAFNDAVYKALVLLCVDICKRNGKKTLLWIPDKDKALSYKLKSDEMLLTVHRWFANKACPGTWMYNRMGKLASEVTWRLSDDFQPVCYRVQAGKYPDKASAIVLRDEVKAKGFPAIVIEGKNKYIVQCGLFESKINARNLKAKLKTAGFSMAKVREVPEVEA